MEIIDSLYYRIIQTPETVIIFKVNEIGQYDQKITTLIHRYTKSCSKTELSQFSRFITGSARFPPSTIIKLGVRQSTSYTPETVCKNVF